MTFQSSQRSSSFSLCLYLCDCFFLCYFDHQSSLYSHACCLCFALRSLLVCCSSCFTALSVFCSAPLLSPLLWPLFFINDLLYSSSLRFLFFFGSSIIFGLWCLLGGRFVIFNMLVRHLYDFLLLMFECHKFWIFFYRFWEFICTWYYPLFICDISK